MTVTDSWVTVTSDALDVAALLGRVQHTGAGAVTCFIGAVREVNDGRAVTGIEYEAYEPMASRELLGIAEEAVRQWAGCRVAIAHRVGQLGLGEASVVIAVSHARRAPALDAQRFCIETLKQRVPIWKREHYVDGEWQWVDPTHAALSTS